MELLTQQLPSGYHYPFPAVHINPMKFAEILEYLENVPDPNKQPSEYYYFNYCLVKNDDINIDDLLLIDFEYVVYMKKAITIAKDLSYDSSIECPNCGSTIEYHVNLTGIQWNKMQDGVLDGFEIKFGDEFQQVRMPSVGEFMKIFSKYRLYKKKIDLKIIKLISLFKLSETRLNDVENMVINATHKDIAALLTLDKVFYNFVKPITVYCSKCIEMYSPSTAEIFDYKIAHGMKIEDDLTDEQLNEIKRNQGGVEIGMDSLVSEFFRDLYQNNRLTSEEVLFGEIS